MLHRAVLALSFLSLLGDQPQTTLSFQALQWPPLETLSRWQSPWVLEMNAPDPVAGAIVRDYLNTLAEQGFPVEAQGVWLQTGSGAVAAHKGDRPLPAASLTKMATTLAALSTWPLDHRFETHIGHTGTVQDGVLQGDLVIRGGGDPYFVWEEAIAIAHRLQQMGIQEVAGNLVIQGDFSMNFEADPARSGELFLQAVDTALWAEEVWWIYDTMTLELPQPSLVIQGNVVVQSTGTEVSPSRWLIRHQSLPLIALLKAMNIYSNNEMADRFARSAGGINTVVARVVEQAQIPVSEIRLINGSGLGAENRLSPRAVVSILLEIQRQLRPANLSVSDVMPVFGQDEGTLVYRELPRQSALKTGTLNTVSSLAGMFPTRDRGPVWFSIQNWGGDLEYLRAQQDALLLALEQHWGQAPPPDTLKTRIFVGQAPYQLGDPSRNQSF